LVLADGASLIMTYDENGDNTLDVGSEVKASRTQLPVGGGKLKDFPYTTSVTGAIDFVMDVNGGKGPNSETINGKWHDIRSFNGAQFAKGMVCDFEVGNLCVKQLTTYSAVDCSNSSSPDYSYCGSWPSPYSNDYWAGAKKACANIEMTLASQSELAVIYNNNCTRNHTPCISVIPNSGFFFSNQEYSKYNAKLTGMQWGDISNDGKKNHQSGVLCVGNN
ncbi:hypothetical protein J6P92_05970, partial [bacterium]|nr:hypothetical protein [bacterium]